MHTKKYFIANQINAVLIKYYGKIYKLTKLVYFSDKNWFLCVNLTQS